MNLRKNNGIKALKQVKVFYIHPNKKRDQLVYEEKITHKKNLIPIGSFARGGGNVGAAVDTADGKRVGTLFLGLTVEDGRVTGILFGVEGSVGTSDGEKEEGASENGVAVDEFSGTTEEAEEIKDSSEAGGSSTT